MHCNMDIRIGTESIQFGVTPVVISTVPPARVASATYSNTLGGREMHFPSGGTGGSSRGTPPLGGFCENWHKGARNCTNEKCTPHG